MPTDRPGCTEFVRHRLDPVDPAQAGSESILAGKAFLDSFGDPRGFPEQVRKMIHVNTGRLLPLHPCGAIMPLMDTICDMGVDLPNPAQRSARGMDLASLKERYAKRIVFSGGGCGTQRVPGQRPTDETIGHVKERLRIAAPGGINEFLRAGDLLPAQVLLAEQDERNGTYGTCPMPIPMAMQRSFTKR